MFKLLDDSAMGQSLAQILVHVVFSTKERLPFLQDEGMREELHRYLGGILGTLGCPPVVVGGVSDHVHLLARLSRTCAAAEMVKELKRGSTIWIKKRDRAFEGFSWQNGYGIFSIGYSQIGRVKEYITSQRKHHLKRSFQDEFRQLMRRYRIDWDEHYVWD